MNRRWRVAAAMVLLGTVAYDTVVRNDYVDLDDPFYVVTNPVVVAPLGLETLRGAFSLTDPEVVPYWQPLTVLSFAMDHAIFGANPVAAHVENVAMDIHLWDETLYLRNGVELLQRGFPYAVGHRCTQSGTGSSRCSSRVGWLSTTRTGRCCWR